MKSGSGFDLNGNRFSLPNQNGRGWETGVKTSLFDNRLTFTAGYFDINLDNIVNIQSSWVTQGPEVGQVALRYGANDFGSIMIEENVVSSAGTTFRLGVADMRRLIEELGHEAVQRDNWYRPVRR